MLPFVLPLDVELQHVAVVGECGHRLNEWHEHGLGFLLPDLNKAVPLKLLFERCREFGELLLKAVILHGGEFFKWSRKEDWNVGFRLTGGVRITLAVPTTTAVR